MDVYELHHEAREALPRVKPAHYADAARMIADADQAIDDMEDRLRKLVRWIERHSHDATHREAA